MIKFGDCTLAKFTALCDRRGIQGMERDNWVRLFKQCASAPGKGIRAVWIAPLHSQIHFGNRVAALAGDARRKDSSTQQWFAK